MTGWQLWVTAHVCAFTCGSLLILGGSILGIERRLLALCGWAFYAGAAVGITVVRSLLPPERPPPRHR